MVKWPLGASNAEFHKAKKIADSPTKVKVEFDPPRPGQGKRGKRDKRWISAPHWDSAKPIEESE